MQTTSWPGPVFRNVARWLVVASHHLARGRLEIRSATQETIPIVDKGGGMRFAVAAVVTALVMGVVASGATADSSVVQHQRYTFSGSFTDTSMCGFPITIGNSANFDDALFFDSAGNLVELLETVNHGSLTFSANGKTLSGIGTGGIKVMFNSDGSVTVNTFGINVVVTIPGEGTVILDAGTATFLFNPHLSVLFHAGPSNYDLTAFCSALS
jgi:hypothetical protein